MVMRLQGWDESNRVAFEPGRIGLIAVGQPPVRHPQWRCAVMGVRGASSSVNCLVFPPLLRPKLRVCLMSQSALH